MTVLDIIVIGVVVLSAVLALFRGFVREIFSIMAWIGAAVAVYFLLPAATPYAQQLVSDPLIAKVCAGVVIFVVFVFAISIIGSAVGRRVRESQVGGIDRSLGLVYGLARGAFLVCLTYIPLLWVYSEKNPPVWIRNAVTRPVLETGAGYIKTIAPEEMFARGRLATENTARDAEALKRATDAMRRATPK